MAEEAGLGAAGSTPFFAGCSLASHQPGNPSASPKSGPHLLRPQTPCWEPHMD